MIKIICLINELFIENGSLEILKRVISPKVVNNVTIKYSLPKYSLDPVSYTHLTLPTTSPV